VDVRQAARRRLAKEEPKIDSAIKNFLSVLLAEGITAPDSAVDPKPRFKDPLSTQVPTESAA
jgi:hypothetical protein